MPELRLFIAVDLPEHARKPLEGLQASLKQRAGSNARWVAAEGFHVTLKFLGSAPAEQCQALARVLDANTIGLSPIEVSLAPASAFKSPRRAQVLILPLRDPTQTLAKLVARLDAALLEFSFPRETRAFVPHVTLARMKHVTDARPWLDSLPLPEASWVLSRLTLYHSELSPQGSRYRPIHSVTLGA